MKKQKYNPNKGTRQNSKTNLNETEIHEISNRIQNNHYKDAQ
jgi:hypothetical protein